jgi:hypothetical protein
MTPHLILLLALTAGLLSGCGSRILEEAGDIGIPGDCRATTKLFGTFNMKGKQVSWSASDEAKEKNSVLTVALSFENPTNWPTALSNSGNGVLYTLDYSLNGEDGAHYAAKETSGILKDVHTLIAIGEMAEGKLVFAAPKANYLLTIERKFAGDPVPGKRDDHLSSCRVFSADSMAVRPSNLRARAGAN